MCVYIRVYSRLDFYIGAFKAKYNFELWPLHTHRCLIYQFFVCSIHYSHCSDSTGQKSGQSHLYALKWSKKDFTLLHIYFSNLLSEPKKLLLKMILNLITLLKHLFSKKYAHILLLFWQKMWNRIKTHFSTQVKVVHILLWICPILNSNLNGL